MREEKQIAARRVSEGARDEMHKLLIEADRTAVAVPATVGAVVAGHRSLCPFVLVSSGQC